MNKKIFLIILFCHFANAESNLDVLATSQNNIDKSNRLENRVVKKDVYSSQDKEQAGDYIIPEEKVCFPLQRVEFEGSFFSKNFFDGLVKPLKDKCIGLKGIENFAKAAQDKVINAGYVTTRLEIPNQDLSKKVLKLTVIPGKIDEIIFNGEKVASWVLPFEKEQILNLRDIEQGLELIQKVPTNTVSIRIEPGSKPNTSNVVIHNENSKEWNVRLWLNNWGDKPTGKNLAGLAFYKYNLLNASDVLYVSGSTNTQSVDGGYKSYSAYYSLPYQYWDFEFFYSKSVASQAIGQKSLDLEYTGKNEYMSMKGSRILYRDQSKKISGYLDLSHRNVNYDLNGIQLVLQKRDMTNARVGFNYKQNMSLAVFEGDLSYQRFLNIPGSKKTPDMISGEVSQESHIVNLNMNYVKYFSLMDKVFYYDSVAVFQYSPDNLTLQDRLSIGSRWSVRGYENGASINGNKGFYSQNNLNLITGYKDITTYIGADYGQIYGVRYPAGSYEGKKLAGAAIGLKGKVNTFGYDVSITTPLIYPENFVVDKFSTQFNFNIQI